MNENLYFVWVVLKIMNGILCIIFVCTFDSIFSFLFSAGISKMALHIILQQMPDTFFKIYETVLILMGQFKNA